MADIYTDVGANIRYQRLEQGLTLEDLADASGLHASFIGQIERGAKKCSLRSLAEISNALGVGAGTLLGPARGAYKGAVQDLGAVVRSSSPAEKRLIVDIARLLAKRLRGMRS